MSSPQKKYLEIAIRAYNTFDPSEIPPGTSAEDLAYYFEIDDRRGAIDLSTLLGAIAAAKNIFANIDSYQALRDGTKNVISIGKSAMSYALPVLIILTSLMIFVYAIYFVFNPGWVPITAVNSFMGIIMASWAVYAAASRGLFKIDPTKVGVPSLTIGNIVI
jgi:hypothetical protein